MITKIQFKRLDSKGLRPFSVKQDVTLEILTSDKSKEGIKKTFIAGGKFMGEPVDARVQRRLENGNWVRFQSGKGFIVVDEDKKGCWIIPAVNTDSVEDDSVNPTVETKSFSTEIKNDLEYINNNPDKKILGFTYKQILIVSVLLLIARKL